jgi:hypothetical protein
MRLGITNEISRSMLPLLSYQLPFLGKNGRFCRLVAINGSVDALIITINKNKLMGRWDSLLCFLSGNREQGKGNSGTVLK